MQTQDSVLVPLRAKDGSVRAYTLIDEADAAFVTTWRWGLDCDGYAYRSEMFSGRCYTIRLHRVLMGLVHGDGLEVDHVNRDRCDNRRSNLRVIPKTTQQQNLSARPGVSSRFRGVYWDQRGKSQRWVAYVGVAGKRHHLGRFTSETEAAEAARAARARLMPFAVD